MNQKTKNTLIELKKNHYLHRLYSVKKYEKPLKRSLSGYEMEMALIDERGELDSSSEKVATECKKINKKFPISDEVGKHMIELYAMPHSNIQKTSLYLIENVEKVLEICRKHNLYLFPLATYPGKANYQLRKKKRYIYSSNTIGKDKYIYYFLRCLGFHYHYTLPKGVFNKKTKFLNQKFHSKIKKTLLDSYNFLIAADPILTTLAQSSPFVGGKYYAKDTRILFWRGGKRLKFKGVFNNLQLLGGLQPYKQTLSDLIHTLNKKDTRFRKLLEKSGVPESFIKKKNKLDFIWNPIKINKLGTLEQRGMDANHLDICLSISVMIKFILRAIQQEFYHVIPSDIGIEEPFKLEGNVILIPSHTYVRNELQYKSAYLGLGDKEVYKSCSRFYNLAKKLVYKQYSPVLGPIKKMLDEKRTVSDQIIQYVKKKGYSNEEILPQEICRKIALNHSKKMLKGMEKIKKRFKNLD